MFALPTTEQVAALRAIMDAIIGAVRAAGPMGAPGGVIYAALMAQGCTLSQYQSLMGAMVRAGVLWREGDLYRLPPKPPAARRSKRPASQARNEQWVGVHRSLGSTV